ncbi:Metallo-hydrolase/oxidoreductase [Artomyces pyxidatus]|uniref:Metallo-hydrolase/oxidoreductase n=1 Tax=Artomyces pyxidatus TaxID=48021 RepID=A0ACB8T678_9AGAM|nr:Metallo-hydrolase/oxidoreductase [Artomyces pyxidatus]
MQSPFSKDPFVLSIPSEREPTFDLSPGEGDALSSSVTQFKKQGDGPESVRWIGNATCIVEIGGVRIMTDPNFLHQGDHVHLAPGVVAQRLKDPAFNYEECPPVDFIILSHLHADHFDDLVAAHLRRNIPIISNPHAVAGLAEQGFTSLAALNTWDAVLVRNEVGAVCRITSMPGKHTLGEHPHGSVLETIPPVMGSLIEILGDGEDVKYTLYISGDTLYYDELKEIRVKYPTINLALLHLGGTTIPVINVMVTMDAEQGMQLLCALNPERAIPIHMDDYDAFLSGLDDFKKVVEREGWGDRVTFLDRGEAYYFSRTK